MQPKCACGGEKGDCGNAAYKGEEAISINRRVHLFKAPLGAARFFNRIEPNCNALVV
jgi:hypothetical protein